MSLPELRKRVPSFPALIWLSVLACAPGSLPSQVRTPPEPSIVLFHPGGRWDAPPIAAEGVNGMILLGLAQASTVIGWPSSLGFWVGIRDSEDPEVFDLRYVSPEGAIIAPLGEKVRDARPSPKGVLAYISRAGALKLADSRGQVRTLAEHGRDPAFDRGGSKLVFVEKLDRAGRSPTSDPSGLRLYRVATGEVVRLTEGSQDFMPALAHDSEDVLFASSRTGMAAFYILRAGTTVPVQLSNFRPTIDADFIPLPLRAPSFEPRTGRVFYELDYGGGSEVWSLELTSDRSAIKAAGRVAVGERLLVGDGILSYTSDGTGHLVPTGPLSQHSTDFGLRKAAPTAPNVTGGPRTERGGIFSPLKVEFPVIYNAFKCNTGTNDPSHPGHDFDAPRFTQQYAVTDGTFHDACDGWGRCTSDSGNYITLHHSTLDRYSSYWHLQAGTVWAPPPSTPVGVGMPVGRTGDSGSANNTPHVHFAMFEKNLIGRHVPVDPTQYYAVDKLNIAPDDYGPWFRGPGRFNGLGSCNLLQLPVPDYVRLSGIDSIPPRFSNFRIIRQASSGRLVSMWFEVTIEDESGVYDDNSYPTVNRPNARGVYLVIDPLQFRNVTTQFLPMSRVSGTAQRGVYRTDAAFRHGAGVRSGMFAELFNYTVVADDIALHGRSLFNIGNGGFSRVVPVTEVTAENATDAQDHDELPMVDLEARVIDAPTRVSPGGDLVVRIRVSNSSRFAYNGGYSGRLALNPTRDRNGPYNVWLKTFPIPPLAPSGSTDIALGPIRLPAQLLLAPQNLIVYLHSPNDPQPFNSAARRLVHIVPPLPDLVIDEMTAPAASGAGEQIVFAGRIRNTGTAAAWGRIQVGASLSLDRLPGGNDIPLGLFPVDLGARLDPGQSVPFRFTTSALPLNVIRTRQYLILCADAQLQILELDEFNNCADRPIAVSGPEVGIVSVTPLGIGIGGYNTIPIRVTLKNSGRGDPTGTVMVTVTNLAEQKFHVVPFRLGPGGTTEVVAWVPAPNVIGPNGFFVNAPVRACHDYIDPVPQNSCANTTVRVEKAYWYLKLSLPSTNPSTVYRGRTARWTVDVQNIGNIPYTGGVKVRSGISLNTSSSNWSNIIWTCGGYTGPDEAVVQGLAPKATGTLSFSRCLHTGATPGTQYFKAQVFGDPSSVSRRVTVR